VSVYPERAGLKGTVGGTAIGRWEVAYKALGFIALIVAALMAFVSVLVLVTFFANFHVGLLILFVIAAAFTWLFFAVGWQLVRPPRGKGGPAEPQGRTRDEVARAGSPGAVAVDAVLPACGPPEDARVPIEAAGSFHGFEDQDIGKGSR
jgi:hypothetical protein